MCFEYFGVFGRKNTLRYGLICGGFPVVGVSGYLIFLGNIYKKVKDPNLVSALSGHKEGSKAFRRYRDIDEEMKKDLVKLLD